MRRRDVMLGAAAVALGGAVGCAGVEVEWPAGPRVGAVRCDRLRGEIVDAIHVLCDACKLSGQALHFVAGRNDPLADALAAILNLRRWTGREWVPTFQPEVRAAIMSTLSFQRGRGASYGDTMRAMVDLHAKFDLAWTEMYDAMRVMCWQPKWDATLGRPDESWSEAALRSVT